MAVKVDRLLGDLSKLEVEVSNHKGAPVLYSGPRRKQLLVPKRPALDSEDGRLRSRAEGDLYFFCTDILRMDRRRFYGDQARDDDMDMWPPLHGEMSRFMSEVETARETYHCLLVARGHLKTSLMIGYLAWRVLRDPDLRVLIVNGNEKYALASMDLLKEYLQSDDVQRLWPDVVWENPESDAPAWTMHRITLRRKIKDRVPTVSVAGIFSGMASMHYHLIVLDDIVNEDNYKEQEQRDRVRDARDHCDHLLRKGGKVINLGTRWHFDDAHGDLVDGAGWKGNAPKGRYVGQVRLMHRSCWADDGENPILPTRWTRESLLEKQGRTPKKEWAAHYLNDPNPADEAIFLETDFRWFRLGEDGRCPATGPLNFYTAVDPNRSEKTQHDPCVVMTGCKDTKGQLWVVEMMRGHPSGPEIVDWIRSQVLRWRPMGVVVETNNFQLQLCHWLREDMLKTGTMYNIQEAERDRTSRKYDRIAAMEPMVRSHGLLMLEGMVELASELKQFPAGRNDDCCDALADLWRYTPIPAVDTPEIRVPKGPFLMRTLIEQTKVMGAPASRIARRA